MRELASGRLACAIAVALLAVAGGALGASAADALKLVDKGATSYVICYGGKAPGSVRAAAQEIQRVIKEATGVEIPIGSTTAEKMIWLGDDAVSRAAGVSAEDLPDDAFRLVTRGASVYIVGKDSPRNRVGWGGAEARGTLFGAYAFLERVVGVRWLSPDVLGEDIPRQEAVVVPALDVTEKPFFPSRRLDSSGGYFDWASRLGCGGWRVNHGHNWDSFPSRAVLRAHPEYLALNGGKRMAVPATDAGNFQPKFCTTNPGLVKAFAEGAIEWLRQNPNQRFVSISPSDGGGWCECPECEKLKIKGPSKEWGDFGGYGHSVAPLILKFYNDVARIVGKEMPDKLVCGYVYYDYTFPPVPMPKMEPNVALMSAPIHHYGLTRYKPEYQDEFERLCGAWRHASDYMGYYGASTWMRVGIGAPLGPSLPVLKHTFATLKKYGFKNVFYYQVPWSMCGAHNYIVAKLMWNPDADADALLDEWLGRAFGPGAEAMGRLYRMLDQEIGDYKKAAPRAVQDYEMSSDMALKVYLKRYWDIEALYKEALAKAATDAQRARLREFGDNLVILCHVFAEAGVLAGAEKSVFYRTAEDYRAFLERKPPAVVVMQGAGAQGGITGLRVPGKRTMALPRLSRGTPAPKLDGDLGDAAWREARGAEQGQAVADKFSVVGGAQPAQRGTQALAVYDNDALYICVRCQDNTVAGKERPKDDKGLFEDDCVELVFGCGAQDPKEVWRLVVNPLNARWDALVGADGKEDASADLAWESATGQGEGYWAVEIRIPFKTLKSAGALAGAEGPPVGMTWRVNLARQDMPGGERSSWSEVKKGLPGDPSELGRWYFPR
ncbi:MAG TPA: DUF4838 domain-containing protein [Candidatus Brocadiia bacterium]|nr:DUF4838 domain-containing protein [Candidatus Brocadiia bacterium]